MRPAITKFLKLSLIKLNSKHLFSLQVINHRALCSHIIQQSRLFSNSRIVYKQSNALVKQQERNILETCEDDKSEEGIFYRELLSRSHLIPTNGHQVLVIQPYIKWGKKRNYRTTPDLMLNEAVALIDSLPKWKTVNKLAVPLESIEKKQLFGKGRLEELRETIGRNLKISAVFISVDFLRGIQKRELEKSFGVPIYDRYSVVLQIFKERAKTYEAKLQVAFAEIPYLKSSLAILQRDAKGGHAKEGGGISSIGGSGESYFEIQRRLLSDRENKIKAELDKIAKKRDLLKLQRSKREFPIVAIVGYTNCGKTTLIKSLTGEASIQPKNALFATLDVTTHACRLPCNLEVLLVDTVGFISDIPTTLIAAFNSTLKDALDADLVVHVQDVSHPDKANQYDTVISTLGCLTSEELPVLNVANKIDKLDTSCEPTEGIAISAINGTGLANLLEAIETKILEVTNRTKIKLRVTNGGDDYRWVCNETAVVACKEDGDPAYLIVTVVLTKAALSKLKYKFPHVKISMPKVL